MRLNVCVLSLVALCSGCVTTSDLNKVDGRVQNIELQLADIEQLVKSDNKAKDETTYCYYENKAFSKGAKLNDKVCVEDKAAILHPAPLIWERDYDVKFPNKVMRGQVKK